MQEIPLSTLQQNTYSIIESIILSNQSVLISDKGKFLVKIIPLSYPATESWLGCMQNTGKITGDIISPIEDANNWEVLA